MANGFTYESPLNRLLSVTIPRFLEGQLERQQRQREFDAQMAFRELQLESQEEFRDRQLDLQEREFQSKEFFEKAKMQRDADNRTEDKLMAQKQFDRAEKIQNENILIKGVSDFGSIDDQIQALSSYKESGQITSTEGLNLLTNELGKLRGIQSKNNTLIKLYSPFIKNEEQRNLIKNSTSGDLKPKDIMDIIGLEMGLARLTDVDQRNQIDMVNKRIDIYSNQLKTAQDKIDNYSGMLQFAEGDENRERRERISRALEEATNSKKNIEYKIQQSMAMYPDVFQNSGMVMAELDRDQPIPVLNEDISAEEAMKLPEGGKFIMRGATDIVMQKDGDDFIPVDSLDIDMLNQQLFGDQEFDGKLTVDGVDVVDEQQLEKEQLEETEDDSDAVSRLVAMRDPDRRMLYPQEGFNRETFIALSNANSEIGDSLTNLNGMLSRMAISPYGDQAEEYTNLVDVENNKIQSVLKDTYKAMSTATDEKTKNAFKSRLDRIIKNIDKAQIRGYRQANKIGVSSPINPETMSLINAIKSGKQIGKTSSEEELINILNSYQNQ